VTKFILTTDYPIALDSPDHIDPRGTMLDNSVNHKFNKFLVKKLGTDVQVLDFGCAGGGMVHSLLDDGILAVGLEGSDYNRNHGTHEWPAIPDNLFTVDLSRPFTLRYGRRSYPHKFDVITMWEFIEHIPTDRLPTMVENAHRHLKEGGLIIGSASPMTSWHNGIQHHLTRWSLARWYDFFEKNDFKRNVDLEEFFSKTGAWVRKVHFNFVLEKIKWR